MNIMTLVVGPLLGAVIGLVTNYVAIVMLFRPHKPWKVFGLTVPFTPGVIPRRHKDLAKSIGNAVGEYIITETELRRSLLDPEVAGQAEQFLQGQLEKVQHYSSSPRQWLDERHWSYQPYLERAAAGGAQVIMKRVTDAQTQAALLQMLRQELERVLAGKPGPDRIAEGVARAMEAATRWMEQSLSAPENLEWFHHQIDDGLEHLSRSDRPLRQWIGEATMQSIDEVIRSQGPTLARLVGDALLDRAIRQKILDALLQLLQSQWLLRALGSAIPPQRMDQILQKVLAEAALYLEREENQAVLVAKAQAVLHDFLDRPVGELIHSVGEERAKAVAYSLANHGVGLLRHPEVAGKAGSLVRRQLQSMGGQSWAELAERLGVTGLTDIIIGRVQARLNQWTEDPRLAAALKATIQKELDRLLDQPVEQWLAKLDEKQTQVWVHELTIKALGQAAHQAPAILRLLDVKQMVTRRVEEFPLPEAERIILEIAGRELAYITYFGGLLGLIIGLVQPLLATIKW